MPVTIEAVYRVVTPLFCAGAEPNKPELRIPSFKGVLRFWWRALAWSRYGGGLQAIGENEDALFGSAGGGQSRVAIRLQQPQPSLKTIRDEAVLEVPGTQRPVGEGARYLGYGIMEAFASRNKGTKAGQLTRACLRAPFEFTVQMRGRELREPEVESLKSALIALGTLGGMGAKSRKGYGSLVLRSLRVNGTEQWSEPQTLDELCNGIASLQPDERDAKLPEFTALSAKARHVLVSSKAKQPVELLDHVGRELLRFRSWGRNGEVFGRESEKNFTVDHDLMKQDRRRQKHPYRIAFGLPHNYGSHRSEQVGPHDKHLDRRASPLFIHIHECCDGPVAVLSFLPARFLPKGRSDISVGGTKIPQTPEADGLYRPIHEFLDRLLDANQRKEPFTLAEEVRS